MDRVKFQILAVVIIAAVGADIAPADDLDAALEAQKKKAARRVYIDSALLHDQKLAVPNAPSETEKAADKEFYRSAEGQLNTAPAPKPAPPAPVQIPVKDKNWLTPALMDEEKETRDQPQWTDYEKASLHNPDLLFPKDSDEETRINQMVQDRLRQTLPASTLQRPAPSGFQDMQPRTVQQSGFQTRSGQDAAAPSYLKPADVVRPSLLPAASWGAKKTEPSGLSLPAAGSGLSGGSPPLWGSVTPQPIMPVQREPFNMLNQNPAPLSPLQQIRKASPINQRDPFSENHMPEIKKSIWE